MDIVKCFYKLWVNGLVVGLLEPGLLWVQSIHQYLVRGTNSIRVQRAQEGHFFPKEEVRVHLNIQLLEKEKNQILNRWNKCHPALKWIKSGCLVQLEVDLPVSLPRWKFMDVQQMKSEASDVVCIQYFLPELIEALIKKDFPVLHSMFSIRNKELCAAYGLDSMDFSEMFKRRILEVSSSMTRSSFHFNPDEFRCVSSGSSPIYYLSDQTDRPFLNWVDSSVEWSIPLHVAVIQRQVYVVR